ATRTPTAIDHIPGSITVISSVDLSRIQLASNDPDQVLAQAIPGYTASMDDLTTSGELLRGRRPQFFLDGVLISTPLRDVGRMAAGMVDPAVIDHIEVINGASAIEGLGGSGGIINYITKTPKIEGVTNTVIAGSELQEWGHDIGWKVTNLTMLKRGNFDFLLSLGVQARPMYYDSRGNLEDINGNGSYMDSKANSVTTKLGYDFGATGAQRVQLYFSDYDLVGNNNFNSLTPGNRALGIVQSAQRGPNPGPPFANHIRLGKASYINSALAGGTLTAIAYVARDDLPNNGNIDPDKQDPRIAPVGTLIDASSITSKKDGLKAYWVKSDFLIDGLVFNLGYDYTEDRTSQDLILTNRVWLPTMHFTANSGYTQMSYDRGSLTLSAGARYQAGKIQVPTFHTLYETAPATGGVTFIGGSKTYTATVFNLGAIYRLPHGWSTYVGFSQGYDLPDIGTVIRNTKKPGQSLATTAEVNPILTSEYETGVNWRHRQASFGADVYYARSPASTQVVTNPNTLLQEVSRKPQVREGVEFSGEWIVTPKWSVSGSYSHMLAYTSIAPGLPVDIHITPASTVGQDPDKAVLRVDWRPKHYLLLDLVGTHVFGMNLNALQAPRLRWVTTPYTVIDGDVTYKTDSHGSLTLGCSNLTNAFHIVNEDGTDDTTYYSIQGRKFLVTYSVTF
ncbi:MAG: TonB-dependent receptor, partial [Acetobacteraceae bacterium]